MSPAAGGLSRAASLDGGCEEVACVCLNIRFQSDGIPPHTQPFDTSSMTPAGESNPNFFDVAVPAGNVTGLSTVRW